MLFTNNGGINGTLVSLEKNFRPDQYVLALLLGLISFKDKR